MPDSINKGFDASLTSHFTGSVTGLELDQGAHDSSHSISPEDRFRVATVRQ